MEAWLENLQKGFYQTFILKDNYMYFVKGIRITLLVTVLALVLGVILGVLVAIIRSAHDQQPVKKRGIVLRLLNGLCKVYLTVIRGTPMMVQLLIMWFVIWAGARATDGNLIRCAVISFGINSGAYVAEIVRSGIMSIDEGQFEAGRSLGLGFSPTMRKIILPQAFRNILPALANEFIVLIKETSISGYIGLADLTKGGDIIRSITYEPLLPLLAVACIYLAIVMLLSAGSRKLERRLSNNDR